MAGNRNSGRRAQFTPEQHKQRGTYRPGVHGPLEDAPKLELRPRPSRQIKAGAKSQRRWIKSAADEIAVRNGCRFDEARAEHVEWFFETYLRFSKGEKRGEPFTFTDWQRDELMYPLFGWVKPDGTRRFNKTYIEIPKKNMKSTTASGIGLYMLVGDGEPGAEVYSLGHDKDQASVVHGVAIHMVEASEELNSVLHINRTTKVIEYPGEDRVYKVLSGEGRGKHGFDMHCAIADELHEWMGDKVWRAIRYAFRARREPILLVITNAGDDMNSVCYVQRQKAVGVLEGKVHDDSMFALVMSAEEDEAEKEIASVLAGGNDIPVAERCNPGIGEVISKDDIIQDIRDLVSDPSERPNLLRLTYGVWVSATGKPLFDMNGWNAGKRDATIAEFYGRTCVAGLDLGETHDPSSLVLNFADDGNYFWYPQYWIPEDVVDSHPMAETLRKWGDEGWIHITSGNTVDYGFIYSTIKGLSEHITIQQVVYDPRAAEWLTQSLDEGHAGDDGQVLVEGLGISRFKFKQSMTAFAAPVKESCTLIANGKIHHPGNPFMDWQMSHCTYARDHYGNKRPVKPGSDDDYRTVDGPQAGVMSQDAAMFAETPASTGSFFVG